LCRFRGVGIDLILQPIAEPVEVALVDGELLARFDLDVRREREDMELAHARGSELADQLYRLAHLVFRELHQDGGADRADIGG
jgi:hypothetical protein